MKDKLSIFEPAKKGSDSSPPDVNSIFSDLFEFVKVRLSILGTISIADGATAHDAKKRIAALRKVLFMTFMKASRELRISFSAMRRIPAPDD